MHYFLFFLKSYINSNFIILLLMFVFNPYIHFKFLMRFFLICIRTLVVINIGACRGIPRTLILMPLLFEEESQETC
jgi:hypothetical protein